MSTVAIKVHEVELLLACARTTRSLEETNFVAVLLQEKIDWDYLQRTAYRHRVAPLLYQQLRTIDTKLIPKDILDQLQSHFQTNRLRNLYMSGELLKLMNKLEACGIPALPYKGPVLASLAYGNIALREFGDLDFLVRQGDVLKAREVLTSLGYRPIDYTSSDNAAAFLRYERQYPFARADGSVVELHRTVAPRAISFLPGLSFSWEHTSLVSFGGSTIPTLSSEDLLLTLCVHGSAHLWERLGWICDIAELLRVSEIDWERLLERARSSKSKRMVILGLLLAKDLLGADLPEEVWRETRTDAIVGALATEVSERLFSEEQGTKDISEASRWRFHLRMLERSQDRFSYCVHRSTTPTQQEWDTLPLPAALFSCYRLLRPVRLGVEWGRKSGRTLPRLAPQTNTLSKIWELCVAKLRDSQHEIRAYDLRDGGSLVPQRSWWIRNRSSAVPRRLRRFVRLRGADHKLLIRAAFLLGAIRLGLWLLPFRTVRRLLARVAETGSQSQETERFFKKRVAWATETAGYYFPPASTCLTQALAAQVLLARAGYPALVRIGVVKGDEDRLEAHAWVESEGEVVTGGFEIERYASLATLDLERR